MKKTLFLAIIGALLLTPGVQSGALAQSGNATNCPLIPFDLHVGSIDATTEGSVTVLQNILVSKGFLTIPVGVSTGYFGGLTRSALASFQASLGISPAVGYFGPITRARLQTLTCGDVAGQKVSIASLSPTSGTVGSQVTIYGKGFTVNQNTVNFGGGVVTNVTSYTGTSITFKVPSTLNPACVYMNPPCLPFAAPQTTGPGNYAVSVSNNNGTSNSLNFIVVSYDGTRPVIKGISGPTSLAVNQTGTWTVSATDPQNGQLSYAVNWGETQYCLAFAGNPCSAAPASGATSAFQQTTSFTHSYSQPGTYTATFVVSNSSGGQDQASITVQVNNISTSNGVSLSQVSPTSGPVNTQVTLYGSGFTATGNQVNFSGGEHYNLNNLSSSNGAITFQIPAATDYSCLHTQPACAIATQLTQPGNHTISVTNANGTSNSLNFNVTSSQPSSVSVSQFSPSSGRVGTQVTVYGSGFTSTNNVIKLRGATIATVNATNSNNNALTFTVPSYYGPTYTDGPTYQVTPGSYDIVVQNANGSSNVLYFTVVQ